MAAQIQIQDTVIELGEEINYNFQVSDIAEISKSKSTYTSSFKIPRLSEFERLFNGLAIPGDRSKFPYQINDVYLLDDYVPIMRGVLVFMRTDELYFNVTAISGAFDFFTEIGETKFSDIDISEIVHEKTLDVVADRIQGLILQPYGGHYTYGFAQFGGMSHYTDGGGPVTVNIDALCPVVTARYLWDKIFEVFPRFTFSGDFYSSQDFERLWVVFPYGPFGEFGEPIHKAVIYKRNYTFSGTPDLPPLTADYDLPVDFVELENPSRFRTYALTSGLCRVNIDKFYHEVSVPSGTILSVRVWKNGSEQYGDFEGSSDSAAENMGTVDVWLDAGDYLTFTLIWQGGGSVTGTIHDLSISLSRVTATENTNDKAFVLKIRDFIKEVMWRYGLLAFVDNNHIDFVRMGDIIESGDVVNWSDKYVRRTEEEYTLDYNQNNWLRHKYDDEDSDYFDRNIEVDNKNIAPEKTIIQSLFYAPSENDQQYRVYPERTIPVRQFLIFEPSINTIDLDASNAEFEFKTQQRHYFARVESEDLPYRIGSATMGGVIDSPTTPGITKRVHIITFADCSFADNPYYDALTKILNPTRAHRIELKLTAIDVNQLSLKKLYYFEQEQARYMLNKLQYKKGTVAKGEFIKISENIPDVWQASGAECQIDGGYRTGWVEYSTLTSPTTGATKPNIPSDPDYVAPAYDPVQCAPQAVLIVSNEDTDHSNPFRLFVDADAVVYRNDVQVAYITDVETRTIPVDIGDTIRIEQRSSAGVNPWPPDSNATLTIESGGSSYSVVASAQVDILNDETFTIQPGVNRVTSVGQSTVAGFRKYNFTTEVNIPLSDPALVLFEIYDLILMTEQFRGTKHSFDNYTSEFNVFNAPGNVKVRAHNATANTVQITQTNGTQTDVVNIPPYTVQDLPNIPKGDLTITVG